MNSPSATRKTAAALCCAIGIAVLYACSATAGPATSPPATAAAISSTATAAVSDPAAGSPADGATIDPATAADPSPQTTDGSALEASPPGFATPPGSEAAAAPTGAAGGGACGLVSKPTMAKILGAPVVTESAGGAACVFHTNGDSPLSVEIAELPSAVLPGQLGDGTFDPLPGLGDKAYWNTEETLLVVVKGNEELMINASVGDDANSSKQAATAVATAALPGL